MVEPFVSEIRIFGFNFPPLGWAFCNGQLMPISQNTALFALLGTIYGGDGKSTFALPDMQGAAPMADGQGPGLTQRTVGESGGSDTVRLLQSEMPVHTHSAQAANFPGDIQIPTPNTALARSSGGNAYQSNTSQNLTQMAPQALTPTGGDAPHNNMMPFLTFNFNIALQGVFPQRP